MMELEFRKQFPDYGGKVYLFRLFVWQVKQTPVLDGIYQPLLSQIPTEILLQIIQQTQPRSSDTLHAQINIKIWGLRKCPIDLLRVQINAKIKSLEEYPLT